MSTPSNKAPPVRKAPGEPQLVKLKFSVEYRRYFDWWRRFRQLADAEERRRPAPKVLKERKAVYKAAGARLPNDGHLPGYPPGGDTERQGWLPDEHGHVAPDVDLMAPMWAESFEGYVAFLLGAVQDHGTDLKKRVLIVADVMGWAHERVRNLSRACLWAHRLSWAHGQGGGDTGLVARWAMSRLHAHYHAHGYDLAPYRNQLEPKIAQPWVPVQVEERRTPMVKGIDRRAWEPRRITMRLARRLAAERLIAPPPPGEEMEPDDLPAFTEQGADYAGLPKGMTPEGKVAVAAPAPTPAQQAATAPGGDDDGEDEDEADDDSEDERDDDSEDEDADDDDTASRAARQNLERVKSGRITREEAIAEAEKRINQARKRGDPETIKVTEREMAQLQRLAEQSIEAEFPGLGAKLEAEKAKAAARKAQREQGDGDTPPADPPQGETPSRKRRGPPPSRAKLDVDGPWAVVDATRDALITVRMILFTYRNLLRRNEITIRTSDIRWLVPMSHQLNADLRRIMAGGDVEAQQIATGAAEPLPESVNVKAARASGGDVFAAMADDAKELYHIATLLKQQSATDHYQRGHTTIGKMPGHGAPKTGEPS